MAYKLVGYGEADNKNMALFELVNKAVADSGKSPVYLAINRADFESWYMEQSDGLLLTVEDDGMVFGMHVVIAPVDSPTAVYNVFAEITNTREPIKLVKVRRRRPLKPSKN